MGFFSDVKMLTNTVKKLREELGGIKFDKTTENALTNKGVATQSAFKKLPDDKKEALILEQQRALLVAQGLTEAVAAWGDRFADPEIVATLHPSLDKIITKPGGGFRSDHRLYQAEVAIKKIGVYRPGSAAEYNAVRRVANSMLELPDDPSISARAEELAYEFVVEHKPLMSADEIAEMQRLAAEKAAAEAAAKAEAERIAQEKAAAEAAAKAEAERIAQEKAAAEAAARAEQEAKVNAIKGTLCPIIDEAISLLGNNITEDEFAKAKDDILAHFSQTDNADMIDKVEVQEYTLSVLAELDEEQRRKDAENAKINKRIEEIARNNRRNAAMKKGPRPKETTLADIKFTLLTEGTKKDYTFGEGWTRKGQLTFELGHDVYIANSSLLPDHVRKYYHDSICGTQNGGILWNGKETENIINSLNQSLKTYLRISYLSELACSKDSKTYLDGYDTLEESDVKKRHRGLAYGAAFLRKNGNSNRGLILTYDITREEIAKNYVPWLTEEYSLEKI